MSMMRMRMRSETTNECAEIEMVRKERGIIPFNYDTSLLAHSHLIQPKNRRNAGLLFANSSNPSKTHIHYYGGIANLQQAWAKLSIYYTIQDLMHDARCCGQEPGPNASSQTSTQL